MEQAQQSSVVSETDLPVMRTLLVHKVEECESAHIHPTEEHVADKCTEKPDIDRSATNKVMNECAVIAENVSNVNAVDKDWEARLDQSEWSEDKKNLLRKVAKILDNDQLGRLANKGHPEEEMKRRVLVDKSAMRMRKALTSVKWDKTLTQWLHVLLMQYLPPTYMASYLDILQTLRSKVPTLIGTMMLATPPDVSPELIAPVMAPKWEPIVNTKLRRLDSNIIIVVLPSLPLNRRDSNRLETWYQCLSTLAEVVHITAPQINNNRSMRERIDVLAQSIVCVARNKITKLRNDVPSRKIIVLGFGPSAALAVQVGASEPVAGVVCLGFAYNTLDGVRGSPDDLILDIRAPILFVVGQNSAKTSSEEMQTLREKMTAYSSLVLVSGAEDSLRVSRSYRRIESVSQFVVDVMILEEVYEFINKIVTNPPGPRNTNFVNSNRPHLKCLDNGVEKVIGVTRKHRMEHNDNQTGKPSKKPKIVDPCQVKRKVGRPRTRPPTPPRKFKRSRKMVEINAAEMAKTELLPTKTPVSPNAITDEDLNRAIQSILPGSNTANEPATPATAETLQMDIQQTSIPDQTTTTENQPLVSVCDNEDTIPNKSNDLKIPMQCQSKVFTMHTLLQMSPLPAMSLPQPPQPLFTNPTKSADQQASPFASVAPPTYQPKFLVVKKENDASPQSTDVIDTDGGNMSATAQKRSASTSLEPIASKYAKHFAYGGYSETGKALPNILLRAKTMNKLNKFSTDPKSSAAETPIEASLMFPSGRPDFSEESLSPQTLMNTSECIEADGADFSRDESSDIGTKLATDSGYAGKRDDSN